MSAAKALLAEALGISIEQIPDDAAIGALPAWDSLGHARLLIALESRLGRDLTPDEALTIEALTDIEPFLPQAAAG